MNALAPSLIAASAAIILLLGLIHVVYTFRGSKLHPRDADLHAQMKAGSPVITRETTMWKTWIGFNASHGLGAIVFGLVFGYLALAQGALLLQSTYLLVVGLGALASYLVLAAAYWFSIPFRGIALATVLYIGALVLRWF
jgi:hypothetical protein